MTWISLISPDQFQEMDSQSFISPVLIFKHSSRCSISDIAFRRIEPDPRHEHSLAQKYPCYFVDLFKYPDLSHRVAHHYKVFHESPQLLLIKDGQCVFESSHLDISLNEIEEQLSMVTN